MWMDGIPGEAWRYGRRRWKSGRGDFVMRFEMGDDGRREGKRE